MRWWHAHCTSVLVRNPRDRKLVNVMVPHDSWYSCYVSSNRWTIMVKLRLVAQDCIYIQYQKLGPILNCRWPHFLSAIPHVLIECARVPKLNEAKCNCRAAQTCMSFRWVRWNGCQVCWNGGRVRWNGCWVYWNGCLVFLKWLPSPLKWL